MTTNSFGTTKQIAYLVDHLVPSLDRWSRYAGIGPWSVYTNVTLNGWCRGRITTVRLNVGISYQDDVQIEIIQVLSKSESPYQDAHGRTLIGMHHVARFTGNIDADIEEAASRGLRVAFQADAPVSKIAYLEATDEPGMLFELIQTTPALLESFARGAEISRNWDGREHILEMIDFGQL